MVISQHGHMSLVLCNTCHHIQLKNITDLGAIFKCLATDSSIRKSPTYAEIEIICPWSWSKSYFQALPQEIHPKSPSTDISIGKTRLPISFPVDFNGWRKRIHLNDNAIESLGLAMDGMSSSSCRNSNFAEGGSWEEGKELIDLFWVLGPQDCRRRVEEDPPKVKRCRGCGLQDFQGLKIHWALDEFTGRTEG